VQNQVAPELVRLVRSRQYSGSLSQIHEIILKDKHSRRSSLSSISDILEPDETERKPFGRKISKPKGNGDKDQDKKTAERMILFRLPIWNVSLPFPESRALI
jgi:hypothetical protein